jgi:NTP pyrophosphatase (non-canonical NTP hydrolase)
LNEFEALRDRLSTFARERDWDQFHSPKNLSMALMAEVGELMEHFMWLTEEQSHNLPPEKMNEVEQELADIMIYLTRIAGKLNVDLFSAAFRKMDINEAKYPAETVRGSAKKYTEYENRS